jgi:hypothetical protein
MMINSKGYAKYRLALKGEGHMASFTVLIPLLEVLTIRCLGVSPSAGSKCEKVQNS